MTPRRGHTWPGARCGPWTASPPACPLRCDGSPVARWGVTWRRTGTTCPNTRRGQSSTPSGNPAAQQFERSAWTPWTADGHQPGKRWRRTFGQKKGAAFAVGAVGGDPLVIVEGEADALASVWLHPGAEVWAAGGGGAPALAPAILENRRRVVIEADPDGPGREAALKLDKALGGRAEISYNRGGDPADEWTDTLGERAAILESDGGLPRHEAERRAWELAIERR